MGSAIMRPNRSMGRPIGESFASARCVRAAGGRSSGDRTMPAKGATLADPKARTTGRRWVVGIWLVLGFVTAYMWLELAAAGGASVAKFRDAVAGNMTPSQIEQAMARAAAWKPRKGR